MNNKSDYLPNYHDHSVEVKEIPEQVELSAPRFPYNETPSVLANWIKDLAEIKSMPPDYIATGLIVSLATLIAGKVKIQPRKNDSSFLITPNLWGMIIGRPSTMKTPALNLSLEYIKQFEADYTRENELALEEYRYDQMIHEAEEKNAKAELIKNMKNRPGIDKETLKEELRKSPVPEQPTPKRLMTNDSTQEKLAELCSYNPEGILVVRDELIGLLNGLNRFDRPNDKAFYLEGWNGTNNYKTDRMVRGSENIERLILSILGGTQPSNFNKYIREALKNEGGDGLIQRFQVLVYPEVSKVRGIDRTPNQEYKESMQEVFHQFHSLQEKSSFDDFKFDEQAKNILEVWESENFDLTRGGLESNILEAHLGKYISLYCSLALIFTLVEDIDAKEINEKASWQALNWTKYLESHARRIFGFVDDPYYGARKIEEKLNNLIHWVLVPNEDQYITARKIYRKGWSGLKDISQVIRSLNQLEHLGWLKSVKAETGGRPETRFYPHPELRDSFVEDTVYGFGDE